jgi:P27 family predicted phage terminase small subunit
LAETTKAWVSFWESEIAGLVTDPDMPALTRLFRMYDQRTRYERIVLKTPFVTGSTGQTVSHPASKEIASLDGRILQLEDRLGITPMARLKLGITFGAAAKSLEDMNRDFEDDPDGEEEDPRRNVTTIETTGRAAS